MSLWKPPWIVTPFYIAKVTMPGRSPSLASLVGLRFRDRIANLSIYCCGQLCCGQCKTRTRKVENGFTFHRVQICRYKMAGFVLSLLTFWIVSVLFFLHCHLPGQQTQSSTFLPRNLRRSNFCVKSVIWKNYDRLQVVKSSALPSLYLQWWTKVRPVALFYTVKYLF